MVTTKGNSLKMYKMLAVDQDMIGDTNLNRVTLSMEKCHRKCHTKCRRK